MGKRDGLSGKSLLWSTEDLFLIAQGSVANESLPIWRQAVKEADESGHLASEIEGQTRLDTVNTDLKFSEAVYQDIKETTTVNNNLKQDDMKPIRADRSIKTARKLAQSDNPIEVAAGLMALTEDDEAIDPPYLLVFFVFCACHAI